ncbi:hypothetical protein DVS77_23615 [Mycolicibacterium moriokaense]|nr:hypothetical protein DVS77_23615 [Mycolicibacterium moriokaense]
MLWPLRPTESARISRSDSDGRRVIAIEHAALAGVTPEMLAWWYGHVPGTMEYAGDTYPRYLVWHPLDHISYDVEGDGSAHAGAPVAQGTALHIVEAFQRDVDMTLDIHVEVERIDGHSAVIAKRILGSYLIRLENEFVASPSGARYTTRMTMGDATLAGKLVLNRVARTRALPPPKLERWIRHHIEEIGNLENFLPSLFEARAEVEP